MALIMQYIDNWNRYMDTYGDPRTKDWPMMSSPLPTLAVCLSYVYLVKVIGPRLMQNRKPFRLQNTLVIYNAVQVVLSVWIFYEIAMSGWLTGHYSFRCQPVEYNNNPRTIRMVHACWWYYFSKFTEFLDTIFFILRKKQSQVTTLHVIHHGCMPMSVWFGVKFTPGGHSTFFGFLNTFVHIIMYTYYMLSAMGPQYQKYLWWKKYLTTLQMVQFILIMVHAFQLLFIECNYPRAFVWWIGMHAVMFFFLFNEFYKQAYKGRQMRHGKNNKVKVNGDLPTANGYTGTKWQTVDKPETNLTNGHASTVKLNGLSNVITIGAIDCNSAHKNGKSIVNGHGDMSQRKVQQQI
uniref:Elongation of very long chain fatty acids protein n=1 Tax=Glossina brevipalpis TaxID=37001 RepID=A0A1A9W6N3_9MUSC